MQQIINHLKTQESFIVENDLRRTNSIINSFVMACLSLDAGIFEPVMNEDDVFENKGKYEFLQSLKTLFAEFRDENTVHFDVSVSDNICNGCSYGKPVKNFNVFVLKRKPGIAGRFISRGQFAFLVEQEDGILKDIYRCLSNSLREK